VIAILTVESEQMRQQKICTGTPKSPIARPKNLVIYQFIRIPMTSASKTTVGNLPGASIPLHTPAKHAIDRI
jgi:hypothetical protein